MLALRRRVAGIVNTPAYPNIFLTRFFGYLEVADGDRRCMPGRSLLGVPWEKGRVCGIERGRLNDGGEGKGLWRSIGVILQGWGVTCGVVIYGLGVEIVAARG
jgi:hypothetical protein